MIGSLILDSREPATWSVPRTGDHEFEINFADQEFKPDEAWVGSFIRFTVELPTSDLDPKEEITIAFLDRRREPGFSTADRSPAHALMRFVAEPARCAWRVEAFEPARQLRPRSEATGDTVVVVFPKPPSSAGPPVQPKRVPPRILRTYRGLDGKLWVEYSVPAPGGTVRVHVYDSKGVEQFRHESVISTPGVYGVEWPESRQAPPPPPGHYRIVVEVAGHKMEAECDL
jgi:hypothetical protein